jgi:Spy/CpxP family protein refolding chaperone
MTRRAYLYFALTFLLGAVVGGAGFFFFGWYTGHWHRGFNKDRVVRHMSRDLKLSPAQTEQLSGIMDDSMQKFRALREQGKPQFDALQAETRDRIRQILTPEQVIRFNEMVRRLDEAQKRRRPPGDP